MKLVPLLIAILCVILWELIAFWTIGRGERSTERIIIAGIIAVVVYEIANFILKKIYKNE